MEQVLSHIRINLSIKNSTKMHYGKVAGGANGHFFKS